MKCSDRGPAALALLFLVSASSGACSAASVPAPPPPPVNWQSFSRTTATGSSTAPDAQALAAPTGKQQAVSEGYASALGSHGFALLGHLLDDDATFSFPGSSDARGRDAVVRAHELLLGAFDERKFAVSRVWRTPEQQAIEWTMTGVQAQPWMGLPATHKPVAIRGLAVLATRDDGAISDVHLVFDVAAAKAVLGAGPKELASLPAPTPPAGAPTTFDRIDPQPDNTAPVRTALDALENTAESAYLDAMTDDVEVHTLERVEPARGKDAQRAYFKALHKAIAELDTTTSSAWSVGPFAVVEYWIDGDQIGPIGWVPYQPERVVKLHVVDINEVRDGRIARIWRYDNPREVGGPGP